MIASLDDAWKWYESTKFLADAMRRLGEKYWDGLDWTGKLKGDHRLSEVTAEHILERSGRVLSDLDDLCILLLFSVFEATVRADVLADIASEVGRLTHPAIRQAAEDLSADVDRGSFYRVMDAYKGADADLVEQVNQVRRYRNWVAHGRRSKQPPSVEPRIAFDRLKQFIRVLETTRGPSAPELTIGQAATGAAGDSA